MGLEGLLLEPACSRIHHAVCQAPVSQTTSMVIKTCGFTCGCLPHVYKQYRAVKVLN